MNVTAKKAPGMARLTLVLFLVTAITALLLGLVNYITADKIAAIKEKKTSDAMSAVMAGAGSFSEVSYSGGNALVTGSYEALDGSGAVMGYVFKTAPVGFGGAIDMVVGVSKEGAITGVSIVTMLETSGLGDKAKDASWLAQYIDGSEAFAVDKDGGEIDALSGATITSRAVTNGVNAALEAYASLIG